MRRILPILALLAACGSQPESPESPVIVIFDEDESEQPPKQLDDAPVEVPDDPSCVAGTVQLGIPADAFGVSSWREDDTILAAWVEPAGDARGNVKWARFAPTGELLDAPKRAGTARLAEAPNFPAGSYATSIAPMDGTVFVAWHTASTVYIPDYSEPPAHSMVLMSAFNADGTMVATEVQASDERYDDYVVDATMPILRQRGDKMVVAWHDNRLNEPRRYGQQGWPNGIYESTYDANGAQLTWDVQVQQSPSIGFGRSFDFSGDGYAFLMGREPHLLAFQGATQDEPQYFENTMFGYPRAMTAHDGSAPLAAWIEDAAGDIVTVMNGSGELVMVDRLDNSNQNATSVRWLRDSNPPVLAWTVSRDDTVTINMASIGAMSVDARGETSTTGTGSAFLMDARQVGDSLEALVRIRTESGANNVELVRTCLDQPSPTYRWHEVTRRTQVRVWAYETETLTMNVDEVGTVRGVWLDIESEGHRPSQTLEHNGVTSQQRSVFTEFNGMDVSGAWTATVDPGDYDWTFDRWTLKFLLED